MAKPPRRDDRSPDDQHETLLGFVDRFVLRKAQESARHEIIERPTTFLRDVCHAPERLFPAIDERARTEEPLEEDGVFFCISGAGLWMPWTTFRDQHRRVGGGHLFIARGGTFYWAEPEGSPPATFHTAFWQGPRPKGRPPKGRRHG